MVNSLLTHTVCNHRTRCQEFGTGIQDAGTNSMKNRYLKNLLQHSMSLRSWVLKGEELNDAINKLEKYFKIPNKAKVYRAPVL